MRSSWNLIAHPQWQSSGAHVDLCSFSPHTTLLGESLWHLFPLVVCMCEPGLDPAVVSSCLALFLLPLLSCPLVSWPASFHCYFPPLFEWWQTGWPVLWYWAVTAIILAGSPCFFMYFVWLNIKAEKGYWWRDEPFQHANYVTVQMTLYQYNRVLSYSFFITACSVCQAVK